MRYVNKIGTWFDSETHYDEIAEARAGMCRTCDCDSTSDCDGCPFDSNESFLSALGFANKEKTIKRIEIDATEVWGYLISGEKVYTDPYISCSDAYQLTDGVLRYGGELCRGSGLFEATEWFVEE